MPSTSTEYYRLNKENGVVTHSCPYCNFTTPYNKSNLMNHIHAKHTPEHKKPFQCAHCERGFSQKSHLLKHLATKHNITDHGLSKKVVNILYYVTITEKEPRSKKTKARRKYYISHPILKSRDMYNNKHEYVEGCFLNNNEIHYDMKNGFINIKKTILHRSIKLKKPCFCIACRK